MSPASPPPAREDFQPPAHWAPTSPVRRLVYQVRLLLDLQASSIERDLRAALARK